MSRILRRAVILAAICIKWLDGTPVRSQDDAVVATRGVSASPQGPIEATASETPRESLEAVLVAFYKARGDTRAWIEDDHLARHGQELLRVVAQCERDGLDPARYAATSGFLSDPKAPLPAESLWPIDEQLTRMFLLYASDLTRGRIDPTSGNPFWSARPRANHVLSLLREAVESKHVERTLRRATPPLDQYGSLRKVLEAYRSIADRGGWPIVSAPQRARASAVRSLQSPCVSCPGVRGAGAPRFIAAPEFTSGAAFNEAVLRERLMASGDWVPASRSAKRSAFDPAVGASLRRFQWRHGLETTGVLDKATLAELNVPVERRIAQIELNLERWRWIEPASSDRFVLVNVPTFELHAYADQREALRMRVITGNAAESPTRVFARAMTQVVFRPYWNVPPSIAENEMWPRLRRNPAAAHRLNLELVRDNAVVRTRRVRAVDWHDGQIRQRPGAANALGLVKFLLPNPFNVYLHDTPNDALFARPRRDFSHGCVRLERPFDLAAFALKDERGWTASRIRKAMSVGDDQAVALSGPFPVAITYFTTWVEPDGTVRFAPDVYEHDSIQMRALRNLVAPRLTAALD